MICHSPLRTSYCLEQGGVPIATAQVKWRCPGDAACSAWHGRYATPDCRANLVNQRLPNGTHSPRRLRAQSFRRGLSRCLVLH